MENYWKIIEKLMDKTIYIKCVQNSSYFNEENLFKLL